MNWRTDVSRQLGGVGYRWLVTGAAGFIGSHLVGSLLTMGQRVLGVDNFATGKPENLSDLRSRVTAQERGAFDFLEGDIRDADLCRRAVAGIDFVLHQAALGSVPRSIEDPILTNSVNVEGFLVLLNALRSTKVRHIVFASSSSVYGDSPALPKREQDLGKPLSPYAISKRVDEIYAENFAALYGMSLTGLRYFNVFGPRQDPNGAYAAVIPRWIATMNTGEQAVLFGEGDTSRDFCYVDNVVQANLRAALAGTGRASYSVFNVGGGQQTSLAQLYGIIREEVLRRRPTANLPQNPKSEASRAGDVKHSLANIAAIRQALNYQPEIGLAEGLRNTVEYFVTRE